MRLLRFQVDEEVKIGSLIGTRVIDLEKGRQLLSESGDNGSFSVSLKTEPSALVIIPVGIDDNSTSEASISPSTLIFTPTNWNNLQTIRVSGKDDNFTDGNQTFGVNLHQIISSDLDYRKIPTSTVDNNTRVIFTSYDNDSAGLRIAERNTAMLSRYGFNIEYTIAPDGKKDFGDVKDFSKLQTWSYFYLKTLKKDLNYIAS